MFIYFHHNKLSSDKKGQFVPVFIVVLVVLIIMALVTVNLSKVALFKTESSNAVDAGGLAAGSVMANVFNGVAQASSQMEASYWEFYALISVSFILSYLTLIQASSLATTAMGTASSALGSACPAPCAAMGLAAAAGGQIAAASAQLNIYILTTWAMIVAVTAFSLAQYYFYLSIRRMAEDGRESAIQMGHQFAFMNSGIGSKLKSGKPPSEVSEEAKKNNYRDTFSTFLDGLGDSNEYTYSWLDGQERSHSVRTEVQIDPVDTFDLKVAILPLPVELDLLARSLSLGYSALASLTTAGGSYASASGLLATACACMMCCGAMNPGCCACWLAACYSAMGVLSAGIAANTTAISLMAPIFLTTAIAWAGLLPGFSIKDSGGGIALLFSICWIDDIVHNRRVKVDNQQHHAGADLGIWKASYPDIDSFGIIDFTGQGSIHPPKLRHDASIVITDMLDTTGTSLDPGKECSYIKNRIAALQEQVSGLYEAADSYEDSAREMDAQAAKLSSDGMPDEAAQLSEGAADLRQKAQASRNDANTVEAEISNLQANYPFCF